MSSLLATNHVTAAKSLLVSPSYKSIERAWYSVYPGCCWMFVLHFTVANLPQSSVKAVNSCTRPLCLCVRVMLSCCTYWIKVYVLTLMLLYFSRFRRTASVACQCASVFYQRNLGACQPEDSCSSPNPIWCRPFGLSTKLILCAHHYLSFVELY